MTQSRPLRAALLLFLLCLAVRAADILVLRWDETVVGTLPEKVVGTALLFAWLRRIGAGPAAIGLAPGGLRRGLAEGLALTAVLYLFAFGAPVGAYVLQGRTLSYGLEAPLTAAAWTLLILMHVFNGLLEEGLFRGLLLRVFLRTRTPAAANLLQAALFGAWHFLWPVKWWMTGSITAAEIVPSMLVYGLVTFLVGTFLGYWALKTGGLWTVTVMHGVSGMVNAVVRGVRVDGEPVADLVGYTVVLVTMGMLLATWAAWRRRPWGTAAWGAAVRGPRESAPAQSSASSGR